MNTSLQPQFLEKIALTMANGGMLFDAAELRLIAARLRAIDKREAQQAAQDRIKWATKVLDEPPFRHGPPPAQPQHIDHTPPHCRPLATENTQIPVDPAWYEPTPYSRFVTKEYLEALQKTETEFGRKLAGGLVLDNSKLLKIALRLSQLESMGVDVHTLMDGYWKTAYEKAGLEYHPRPVPYDGPNPAEVDYIHVEPLTFTELEGPPLPPLEYLTWEHIAKLTRREVRAQYGEEAAEWARYKCIAGARSESNPSRMTES